LPFRILNEFPAGLLDTFYGTQVRLSIDLNVPINIKQE